VWAVADDWLMDGGFVTLRVIEAATPQVRVLAPVPEPKDETRDRYAPRPGDAPAVTDWRQRMGTAEAKETYKLRAATVECVNAQARGRHGVQQVRGGGAPRCAVSPCGWRSRIICSSGFVIGQPLLPPLRKRCAFPLEAAVLFPARGQAGMTPAAAGHVRASVWLKQAAVGWCSPDAQVLLAGNCAGRAARALIRMRQPDLTASGGGQTINSQALRAAAPLIGWQSHWRSSSCFGTNTHSKPWTHNFHLKRFSSELLWWVASTSVLSNLRTYCLNASLFDREAIASHGAHALYAQTPRIGRGAARRYNLGNLGRQ